MSGATNQWQRVDSAGCLQRSLAAMFLGWVVIVPYAALYRSYGWLGWSLACVAVGAWMTWRMRRALRWHALQGLTVEVTPTEARVGEHLGVRLELGGEVARTVRWCRASLMAAAEHEAETVSTVELVVDPAEGEPVAELQMWLEVGDSLAWEMGRDGYVQVMVETERGRMESGRVRVRIS